MRSKLAVIVGMSLALIALASAWAASVELSSSWVLERGGAVLLATLCLALLAMAITWVGASKLFALHAARKRERARAKSAERRYEEILGIVGHDLRTPLHAIRLGAATLLRHHQLPPAEQKIVSRICSSADRMARLISELQDFTVSHVPTGLALRKRRVDLKSVCAEVVEEMRAAYPGREVVIDTRGDTTGEWDPDRLAQVVSNLVGNALLYGSTHSSVRLTLFDHRGQQFLAVHNEGAAISGELLPRLFEPFRRGSPSNPGHPRGLGLGLYISRQIVMAHGGDIGVRSTAADGTTFTVRLPRVWASSPPSPIPPNRSPPPRWPAPDGGPVALRR